MKTEPIVAFGKTVVAVEPGNEWFKLVQITRGHSGFKLGKVILKRAEELESLAGPDILKALGVPELEGVPVVACLPRHMVNVRLFDLPSGDHQEIEDMVDLQIARQTPYSRDEIVFDYRLFRAEKEGYTRVMLVIVQTGVVRQKCRLLEDAGLQVGLVTTTTDGWLAALQSKAITCRANITGATAFFDMDSTSGDFVVLNSGVPLFSRNISLGADPSASPDLIERCVAEIGRALETYRNETQAVPVTSMVLFGGAARYPGLDERIKTVLKLEVTTTEGIEKLVDDHLVVAENKSVSLAGVLGAASSSGLQVNLMPESIQLRKSVISRARRLAGTGILILAITGLLSLLVMSRVQQQETYLKELTRMVNETAPAVDELDSMRRKMTVVSERMGSKLVPVKALMELYNVTSDSTAFTAIEITDASQLVCRGTADTVADAVKLVNTMESSPLFKNVKNTRTVSGKDRTEFEISCELEKRKP